MFLLVEGNTMIEFPLFDLSIASKGPISMT